jgi:trans-aconitate methyltransferase
MWNPKQYDERHHYVTDYGADLVSLLDPKPGERILDFGCGTGHLTNKIAQSNARVVGIDSSADMFAQALNNNPEIDFQEADGATFRTTDPFDAVFSNAALHWMKPPDAVGESLASALKPGGRLVAEMGGKGNVQTISDAVGSHPWYFPGIGEYSSLLERHGLEVETAALFARPTAIEGEHGLRDWLKMFYSAYSLEDRFTELEEKLRLKLYKNGAWYIDYVRLRVTARKPSPDSLTP